MRNQPMRTLLPVALAVVSLTGCGRADRSSDNVVPVSTDAPVTTEIVATSTQPTTADTTAPVPVTVDPSVDEALAELDQLVADLESDLKAGDQAAANGG